MRDSPDKKLTPDPARPYLWPDQRLLEACEIHTHRASGPGGQKRNKTESAVKLHHRATGIIVVANESRSQHENRRSALHRMREALAIELRCPIELGESTPSPTVTNAGIVMNWGMNDQNPDFPTLAGLVLDIIDACAGRLSDAARAMGRSTGQLAAFCRAHPRLLAAVNRLRARHGFGPVK